MGVSQPTPVPVDSLPRKTSYGPFVRIVEPGRHVYRTTMTFIRWAGLIVCLGGAVALGRAAIGTFESRAIFAVLFGFMSLVMLAIGVWLVAFRTNLEITRERVRVRKWGYL